MLEWALVQIYRCPYEKRKFGHTKRQECAHREESHVRAQWEKLSASQRERPQENWNLQISWPWTSSLQYYEKITFWSSGHPNSTQFCYAAEQTIILKNSKISLNYLKLLSKYNPEHTVLSPGIDHSWKQGLPVLQTGYRWVQILIPSACCAGWWIASSLLIFMWHTIIGIYYICHNMKIMAKEYIENLSKFQMSNCSGCII